MQVKKTGTSIWYNLFFFSSLWGVCLDGMSVGSWCHPAALKLLFWYTYTMILLIYYSTSLCIVTWLMLLKLLFFSPYFSFLIFKDFCPHCGNITMTVEYFFLNPHGLCITIPDCFSFLGSVCLMSRSFC